MNRITNAFSAAIPSTSGSDAFSIHRDSLHISFPFDPPLTVKTHSTDAKKSKIVYDDPRSIYYPPLSPATSTTPEAERTSAGSASVPPLTTTNASHPSRPAFLRHRTEDGLRFPGPSALRTHDESRDRDQSVRVNLMAIGVTSAKRGGWGMNSATGTTRLNRMADGPEGKYAVGGGQYLRILQIVDPDSVSVASGKEEIKNKTLAKGPGGVAIVEVINLWKKNWPVGKGVNDVGWGVGSWDRKVVTATPNGNVMLFDVEKGKLENEFANGSYRPLNCAQFSHQPSHSHMVLIGGADGNVKLLDLRSNDPTSRRPLRHSSAITSVCFSPVDASCFAVGLDDGTLKRYDWRLAGKHLGTAYGAHGSKAVMDLKWKVADDGGAGWLASAGANRIVQIWDMNQSWDKIPTAIHSLHTSHPVRRIAWRPGHPTELLVVPLMQALSSFNSLSPTASSPSQIPVSLNSKTAAINADTTREPNTLTTKDDSGKLEIWHVRRHYIAKYSIPSPDGVAVDASWRKDSSAALVVAYRSGGFAQLDVSRELADKQIPLPLDQVPRQVSRWNAKGNLAFAVDRFRLGELPFDDIKPECLSHYDKPTIHSISDPPYRSRQALGSMSLPDPFLDQLTCLSLWYRLEGKHSRDLCEWNGNVAMWCGREEDARFWNMLQNLFDEFMPKLEDRNNYHIDVYKRQLQSQTKPSTPLPMSLDWEKEKRSSIAAGNHVKARQEEREISAYLSCTPIPLQRVSPPLFPSSNPIDKSTVLSPTPSTSSKQSYLEEELDKPHSRFVSFVEPNVNSLKFDTGKPRRYSTVSSQGSPLYEKKNPSESSPVANTCEIHKNNVPTATLSTSSIYDNLSGSGTKKQSLSKTVLTSSSRSHSQANYYSHHVASLDWPDPYGIIPENNFSNNTTGHTTTITSRASSRSSLALLGNPSLKNSPRDSFLAMPTGEPGSGMASCVGQPEVNGYGKGNVAAAGGNTSVNATAIGSTFGPILAANCNSFIPRQAFVPKEEDFGKEKWEEYKKRRLRSAMTWWATCVDQGDLQLATTTALILAPLADISSTQLERLTHAYIDLLERHRLFSSAAYIRRFSNIPSLEITAHDQGVTHPFFCERCGKSTGSLEDIGVGGKVFWWCKRCRLGAKACAICRKYVKGLWMGCRQCNHGGHQICMRYFYRTAPLFPLSTPALKHHGESYNRHPSHAPLGPSSSFNTSVISGFTTLSSTEVSHVSTDKNGDEKEEEGYIMCPMGCGCRCKRLARVKVPAPE
ncbi:uncharacterized protein L203_106148 [Cryptococcus depauperatus CBS 7841]|uniref:Vacuolar protein n=1 Tax=Cryptococcus depauperatus CBS 7841 TaxID=1295531 RepID=A0AAJ8JYQ7_9TREE